MVAVEATAAFQGARSMNRAQMSIMAVGIRISTG
jgi:hypothetical protein